jgi:hypothetical protein
LFDLPAVDALAEHVVHQDLSRASSRATNCHAALATAAHATTSQRFAGSTAGQNEHPGRSLIVKLNDHDANNQLDLWCQTP